RHARWRGRADGGAWPAAGRWARRSVAWASGGNGEDPQARAFSITRDRTRPSVQPAMLQQRLHARLLAAEFAIRGAEVARVADREDLLAEHLPVLPRQPAVLAEPLERVVVQHLR